MGCEQLLLNGQVEPAQGLGTSWHRAWGHCGTGLGDFIAQSLGTLWCRAWGFHSTELWVIVAQGSGTSWHRSWGHRGAGLGDIMAPGLGTLRHRAWGLHGIGQGDVVAQGLGTLHPGKGFGKQLCHCGWEGPSTQPRGTPRCGPCPCTLWGGADPRQDQRRGSRPSPPRNTLHSRDG